MAESVKWKIDYSINWHEWIEIAERQHSKDIKLFVPLLDRLPKSGNILELGAGVGQLSLLAKDAGFNITSSDVEPQFITHMKSKGLNAKFIDALNVKDGSCGIVWDGIFTQGVSTIVTTDLKIVARTYRSVFDALKPGGLFLTIHPRNKNGRYSLLDDHKEIYTSCGFTERFVTRQQILPSKLYRYNLSMLPESLLGRYFGIRDIAVLIRKDV